MKFINKESKTFYIIFFSWGGGGGVEVGGMGGGLE